MIIFSFFLQGKTHDACQCRHCNKSVRNEFQFVNLTNIIKNKYINVYTSAPIIGPLKCRLKKAASYCAHRYEFCCFPAINLINWSSFSYNVTSNIIV